MAKHTFTHYADPGHGWIKVPTKVLFDLGIDKTQFTTYSYQRKDAVYLEEDGDAYKFLKLYKHIKGVEPTIVTKHTNRSSRIRSYESLKA